MPDEQVVATAATPDAKPAESSPAPEAKPTEGGEKTPEQIAADAAEKEKHEAAEREEEEKVKRKPWFQKRIDEQTKKYREQERRAERLEQSLQQALDVIARSQPKPEPVQAKPPETPFQPTRPAPTREQFEFDEDKYVQAVVDWKIEQTEAQRANRRRAEESQRTQREFATTVETRRTETLQKGGEKYPDFDAVVGAIPAHIMNPEMAIAVLECENAADVAYHLGKNPAVAEQIAKLPPLKKAIALGRLEATLNTTTKPTTKAPPPPSPVGGKEPASTDPDKLPIEEWVKLRNAGKI